MKNIKKIAQELLDSDPKGSQIEDDVSLCEYVSKTQGIELTLKELGFVNDTDQGLRSKDGDPRFRFKNNKVGVLGRV